MLTTDRANTAIPQTFLAAIGGELASRVKSKGALFQTGFAMILTIADGQVALVLMIDDSFDVSQAARGDPTG